MTYLYSFFSLANQLLKLAWVAILHNKFHSIFTSTAFATCRCWGYYTPLQWLNKSDPLNVLHLKTAQRLLPLASLHHYGNVAAAGVAGEELKLLIFFRCHALSRKIIVKPVKTCSFALVIWVWRDICSSNLGMARHINNQNHCLFTNRSYKSTYLFLEQCFSNFHIPRSSFNSDSCTNGTKWTLRVHLYTVRVTEL